MRSEAEVKRLLKYANKVARRGVRWDDGYTYSVPAKEMAEYASVILELITVIENTGATR